MTCPEPSVWLEAWDNPDFEYVPDQPSLKNYRDRYWATRFPDFEAATRYWSLLMAEFGMEADEAVEYGMRWAMRHGYFPSNYSSKPIRKTDIQALKARFPVEDVASRLTELRGNGKNLTGKCPFHDDRSPSFVVWPGIQKWRCYGCGLHGDSLDLIEKGGIPID